MKLKISWNRFNGLETSGTRPNPFHNILTFQKLNNLKLEADKWQEQADELQAKVKALEQLNIEKDHEILSLKNSKDFMETEMTNMEKDLADLKKTASESHSLQTVNETNTRKLTVLEEELDEADKNLKETTAKLRETDIRAEQLERKVASLEAEKEEYEKKFEALTEQYNAAKAELDEISQQLDAI